MLDLDSIESKHGQVVETAEWQKLVEDVSGTKKVYAFGNGGLWAVASHGSDDVTRLTDKVFTSLDSQCLMTSIANDYGFGEIFKRWLTLEGIDERQDDIVIIGLSCSGTSENVVKALEHFADTDGVSCHLISGHPSEIPGVNNVALYTDYFHVTEILTLILFYELVVATGNRCPLISEEKVRKGLERSRDT